MASVSQPARGYPALATRIDAFVGALGRHWLALLNLALGIWVGLPWLAPVFMRLGWQAPARLIYSVYSLFCHQLPQRSWFLFGQSFTPTLAEIQRASGAGTDFFALRQFIGNPELGWKVAWSDRMVSFYGGWFLFGLVFALARRYLGRRGLSWRTAALLLLPMFLDGVTHAVSDLWGVGAGFRDTNTWLAALTGGAFPAAFYAGDAWGSFNSLARLVTGLLAACALVFWLFPWLDRALSPSEVPIEMPSK